MPHCKRMMIKISTKRWLRSRYDFPTRFVLIGPRIDEGYQTIADSSKIHTNIGLIYATLGEHELAVRHAHIITLAVVLNLLSGRLL